MPKEEPLYDDGQIRINHYEKSPECHEMRITKPEEKYVLLQRGVLEDLARTSRKNLKRKLAVINPPLAYFLEENKLVDAVGLAVSQAYIEETERFEAFKIREGL